MNLKKTVLAGMAVVMSFLFVGGDEKEVAEFNKPALYWYQQIANSITHGNLIRQIHIISLLRVSIYVHLLCLPH